MCSRDGTPFRSVCISLPFTHAMHVHTCCVCCHVQFVSDDIEVIEDTIPKLESFQSRYNDITSDMDGLLNRIDRFSVSAISTDALAAKSKGLQVRACIIMQLSI